MRILHTSDWHLGRSFKGVDLLDSQREVVERIVALTIEHDVELVVIAGDLFDRAYPPSPAVDLLDQALTSLRATGAQVAAISGNHDSASRVGVDDRLLNTLGVAKRGQVARLLEPLVVTDPADGGPPVVVYLIPFLEPSTAAPQLTALGTDPGLDPEDVANDKTDGTSTVGSARRRVTQDSVVRMAAQLIRAHHAGFGSARSVVVAHTFVAGGEVGESERALSVGDVDRVGIDAFDGFDYVALGHLHRPQSLGGQRLAYSGSPLPYSFSEEGQHKSVRIVDLGTDGTVDVDVVPLGCGRKLSTLTGTIDELLADPEHNGAEAAWVRVRLTDRHLPLQAMSRLRKRFPYVVELRHEPAGLIPATTVFGADTRSVERLSPTELALQFWTQLHGGDATSQERDLLERAIAAASVEAVQ